MFEKLSRKQKGIIGCIREPDTRFIVAEGAVRSGKTYATLLAFLLWSSSGFVNRDFLFAGKSLGSIRRNLLQPLEDMAKGLGIHYEFRRGDSMVNLASNRIHLFGGSDVRSSDRVQGLTAAGAVFDEMTLMPKNFIQQCLAR